MFKACSNNCDFRIWRSLHSESNIIKSIYLNYSLFRCSYILKERRGEIDKSKFRKRNPDFFSPSSGGETRHRTTTPVLTTLR